MSLTIVGGWVNQSVQNVRGLAIQPKNVPAVRKERVRRMIKRAGEILNDRKRNEPIRPIR